MHRATRRGLLHPPDRAIVDRLGTASAIRVAALSGDAIAGLSVSRRAKQSSEPGATHHCSRVLAIVRSPSMALCVCHGCGSRVSGVVVTADDGRIVRCAQSAAADSRLPPGGPTLAEGTRSEHVAGNDRRRAAETPGLASETSGRRRPRFGRRRPLGLAVCTKWRMTGGLLVSRNAHARALELGRLSLLRLKSPAAA